MDLGKVDKTALKSIIREILKEDISIFKDVIEEILVENQVITSKKEGERRKMLEKMVSDDFDKYDDTFKALA